MKHLSDKPGESSNLIPVYLRQHTARAAIAAATADGRSLSDWLHGLIQAAVQPDEVGE